MARKDVLLGITQADSNRTGRQATPGYASRGASRSMINSLGELAEKAARADQLLEGEVVQEVDAALIEASFVSDRMDEDDEAFQELVAAIESRGQDSPVLLRPHPAGGGRYQVVFGHRRVRAARQLGRPVRAVVKEIDDRDHVIAQGQENSARENLSFIERASFAQKLIDLGYDRPTIQSALAVDAPMLTRMLSVSGRVPAALLQAIGAAKSVGRDRWLELTQLVEKPSNLDKALGFVAAAEFLAAKVEGRFELLLNHIKRGQRGSKGKATAASTWAPADKSVSAEFKNTGKAFSLSLKAKDAGRFGQFLSSNLDRLYEQFRREEESGSMKQGD